jgi:hypothetical protein
MPKEVLTPVKIPQQEQSRWTGDFASYCTHKTHRICRNQISVKRMGFSYLQLNIH